MRSRLWGIRADGPAASPLLGGHVVHRAMVRRPRLSLLVSLLLALGVLAAVQYHVPQAARATALASPAAAPAHAPPLEICDVTGSPRLCANRAGGGQGAGTTVIAWPQGDNNNDFFWEWLSGMCGHGRVTANPPCPFTPGGGLNSRYNGAFIAAIWDSHFLCLANLNGGTILETCPDINGNGGADGTIFILPQIVNPSSPQTTYAVNRYWSDNPSGGNGTSPRWLCVLFKGSILTENSPQGNAGTCQWNQGL
jgi:hypothetical protein